MKRNRIHYHLPKKRFIPNLKETKRTIYATDEQFLKIQLYLDQLKKENNNDKHLC